MDRLRQAIAAGTPTFGTWVTIGSTLSAETVARAGYDWVILDAQHGGITWDAMLPLIQVLDLTGTPAFVRVGWNDPALVMRALDLGAAGVVVPMVSTAEQARAAVAAVRFPPDGIRSFGPVRSYYVQGTLAAHPLCLPMIETAEAMDNLDAIAATPGVDGLLVGPVDLALSLGVADPLTVGPQVSVAIDRVVAACRAHGIVSACAGMGPAHSEALTRVGVQLVTIGSDVAQIRKGAQADLALARAWGGPAAA